jgi:hypothetical protein
VTAAVVAAAGSSHGRVVAALREAPTSSPAPMSSVMVPARVPWLRGPELTERIVSRANEPWISLGLGGHELARVPLRALVTLTGSSGAGKTSLALQIGTDHARSVGPFVYLTLELDEVEAGARIVGQSCNEGWEDVLRGRIETWRMTEALDLPRLFMLEGHDATVENMARALAVAAEEFPGEPCLVVVDYLQIIHAVDEAESERTRVADVIERLRVTAKQHRVVILDLSQTSRAAAKGLHTGDLVGADTTSTGAETARIEHASYVTIALGAVRDADDGDGKMVDLSIGKSRMGVGDVVLPLRFRGRTGFFEVVGAQQPAAEVKAAAAAAAATKKAEAKTGNSKVLESAVYGVLQASESPLTRDEVRTQLGKKDADVRAAIDRLLKAGGEVTEVMRKTGRATSWQIWTKQRAAAADLPIVTARKAPMPVEAGPDPAPPPDQEPPQATAEVTP